MSMTNVSGCSVDAQGPRIVTLDDASSGSGKLVAVASAFSFFDSGNDEEPVGVGAEQIECFHSVTDILDPIADPTTSSNAD